MRTAVVTDSVADIPPEVAAALNIQVIKAIVVMDGRNLEDGEGITREEFYDQLPHLPTHPTTATPSSAVIEGTYRRLFDQGIEHIFSIHPPIALSGLYNAAALAAKPFKNRVHVIESSQVSLGQGFQAIAAAEASAAEGTIEQILRAIQEISQRVHLVAMLDTLEYVKRSGRVSWARAGIGNLLQFKPFVTIKDGIVGRLGEERTRRKGILRLYEFLRRLGPLDRLAILHTNALTDARQMAADFSAQSSQPPFIVNVTTVIGAHVGPHGLGFVAVTAPPAD